MTPERYREVGQIYRATLEVPAEQLYSVLGQALEEAETTNVGGRDLTPFLLSRMATASEGATLRANIALLENNVRIAAEVAKAL